MQYEAKTPTEYFDGLESDWRKEKLLQVREMILKHAPHLSEGIEYKMLSYGNGEKSIFNLNVQRAYVSLYVGDIDKVDGGQELLQDFDCGKGCIRIKKKVVISETGLGEFIKRTVGVWEEGGNTDC